MAVLKEKQFFITFDICGLTRSKQYKSILRRKLTETLIFPKSSYITGIYDDSISMGTYVSIAIVL